MKDFTLWMHIDPALHGPSLEVSNMELFGFNTGTFEIARRDSLVGTILSFGAI
jgi:hypothetical protein